MRGGLLRRGLSSIVRRLLLLRWFLLLRLRLLLRMLELPTLSIPVACFFVLLPLLLLRWLSVLSRVHGRSLRLYVYLSIVHSNIVDLHGFFGGGV